MRRYLLLLLTVGACVGHEDSGVVALEDQSAQIVLVGDQVETIAFDVVINGQLLDGSPIGLSESIVQSYNPVDGWTTIDNLALTTGDQLWHPDATTIHLVDTRHAAPAGLLANCGQTVTIESNIDLELDDYSVIDMPSAGVEAPIVCY